MKLMFWLSVLGVVYPYFGYPLVLWLLGRFSRPRLTRVAGSALPSITMVIPVHNEVSRIGRKIANTAALRYPAELLQVLFVSDGSTDDTVDTIRSTKTANVDVVILPARGGKAQALNAGLQRATHDILVFSDASIELEPEALERIVGPFEDPRVGCVSGEDRIAEAGGEGLYGRYELLLRRLESAVHSIAGASGSFYAQRRVLCAPFTEGMAPDFLSVLRTVEQGFLAVSEPTAVGAMTSVKDPRQEFERKVRTLIRGMTTIFAHSALLNPSRFGAFAFIIWSHKIMRWTAPVFLLGALLSPLALLDSTIYQLALVAQVALYATALVALAGWTPVRESLVGKVALYFSSVNVAVLSAWWQYWRGVRQELWTPSSR